PRVWAFTCLALAGACAPRAQTSRPQADAAVGARLGHDVVAVVGGEAITLAEVAARARRDASDPLVALRALEDERLWVQAARGRGYGERPEVAEATRRASVRALLAQLEREVPASSLDEAAVRAHFEATRAHYDRPERRDIVHLLVTVPEGASEAQDAAAHARATHMAERLAQAPPPARERLLDRFDGEPGVEVEAVPALATTTPFDPAFVRAVFSSDSVGVLRDPVRAADGWHVIWVRSIHPASRPIFAEHRDEARADLLATARAQRLQRWLAQLRSSTSLRLDEAVVRRRLTALRTGP
ncbi:MAG: peptidyl-prolyl cis-trans isomerase, partial [Deltaproteobacteria bacterium]|nr:peptidyl-prolyl cis-trans isomerase [Deltaproteobacteria bacterium]